MRTLIKDNSISIQTAGLSAPWQILSSTDATYLPAAYEDTAVALERFVFIPVVIEFPTAMERVEVEAPSREQMQLQHGLVSLLRFSLAPDEPQDGDITYQPRDRFPD